MSFDALFYQTQKANKFWIFFIKKVIDTRNSNLKYLVIQVKFKVDAKINVILGSFFIKI